MYIADAPVEAAPCDGGGGVPAVPFAAIKYAIGECNYGGRVTDDKDRRLLTTILECVYRPDILAGGEYALSASGTYAVPAAAGDRQHYLTEIGKLPPMPQVRAMGPGGAAADLLPCGVHTNQRKRIFTHEIWDLASSGGGRLPPRPYKRRPAAVWCIAMPQS